LKAIIRTPPNLRAFAQMTLKNLKTGKRFMCVVIRVESFDILKKRF